MPPNGGCWLLLKFIGIYPNGHPIITLLKGPATEVAPTKGQQWQLLMKYLLIQAGSSLIQFLDHASWEGAGMFLGKTREKLGQGQKPAVANPPS